MKEYQDFLNAFEELKKLVEAYHTYNDYGEQPKMSKEDVEELNQKYLEVFKLGSVYLESVPEDKAEEEKARMENADLIQEQLQKDMNALLFYKPDMTLPECMKYSNSRVVNVSGKTFDKTGANTNTRYKMTITGPDGKPISGFFTERHYLGLNPANSQFYIDKLSRQNPKLSEIFQYAIPKMFEQSNNNWCASHMDELKNQFGKIEGFNTAIESLTGLYDDLTGKEFRLVNVHIGESNSTAPLDTRNIAMSNIAHMLGIDNIIAKSTLLTIKNKGIETQGCFMEFAKGEDPQYPKLNSRILKMPLDAFDNNPVLKTLSDLQVLDYICGNTDRHALNMFVSCDENGKPFDVMGIDNDMSFGYTNSNYPVHLNVFHMSKSMADKILNLDRHLFIHSLDGLGLEKKNIDFALLRFDKLKDRIKEGNVIVIDDKDYENYKLEDFLNPGDDPKEFRYKDKSVKIVGTKSIYKQAQIITWKMDHRRRDFKTNPPDYEINPKSTGDSDVQLGLIDDNLNVESLELGTDSPALTSLSSKLSKASWFISNSSPEFENVKRGFEKIKENTDAMSKDESLVTPHNVEELRQCYSAVLGFCADYLQHKKNQGKLDSYFWTPTGRRISAVKAVADFCKGKMEVLQKALDNTLDKEVVEKREVREMKDDAQKLMIQNMTQHEIGAYVKSLVAMHDKNPDNLQMTAKIGQQLTICMDIAKEKGGGLDAYNISEPEAVKVRSLLKAGRLANSELKKDEAKEVKNPASKSAVMQHKKK